MRISDLLEDFYMLDEITRPANMSDAKEILIKAGYDLVGSGLYANVFIRPGEDSVLKLFNAEDNAYIAFYNLVRNNNNTHFPKFKGRLMKITGWYYAARIEKLEPLPPSFHGYNTFALMLTIHALLNNRLNNRKISNTERQMVEFIRNYQPGFLEALQYLHKTLGQQHRLDIHPGNVMLRGDTMVITDPFSSVLQ